MSKKKIIEVVADKIAKSGEKVAEIVTDKMVNVEIDRRVGIIELSMKVMDKFEKEFKKINRPDNVTYNASREKNESYTQKRIDEINKLDQKMKALESATDAALEGNTAELYVKLEEQIKKCNDAGGNKTESTE